MVNRGDKVKLENAEGLEEHGLYDGMEGACSVLFNEEYAGFVPDGETQIYMIDKERLSVVEEVKAIPVWALEVIGLHKEFGVSEVQYSFERERVEAINYYEDGSKGDAWYVPADFMDGNTIEDLSLILSQRIQMAEEAVKYGQVDPK